MPFKDLSYEWVSKCKAKAGAAAGAAGAAWIAPFALDGEARHGCAINALTFLGFVNYVYGHTIVETKEPSVINPDTGTDIVTVMQIINNGILHPTTILKGHIGSGYVTSVVGSETLVFWDGYKSMVGTMDAFLTDIRYRLGNKECTIVKLNKNDGMGHTIILYKEGERLRSIDLQQSPENIDRLIDTNCSKIYDAWEAREYISITCLVTLR